MSGVTASLSDDGAAVLLGEPNTASRLRYAGLKSWDAEGTELVSRLAVSEQTIVLRVDDARAVYPVTIDPALTRTEDAKLTAGDKAIGDRFGIEVSVFGDTLVVGADWDDDEGDKSGSAYVFVRNTTSAICTETGTVDLWCQEAKLTAFDGAMKDQFGFSVAIASNTVVVGALFDDTTAGLRTGSAYVFERSGTTWTEQAKLLSADLASNDDFGENVRISEDENTLVVGGYRNDDFGSNSGSAYVFVRNTTSAICTETGSVDPWCQQAKLTASDGAAEDRFGIRTSISGDTILVGAFGDDSFTGSAYVFVRSGTTWTQQAKLIASGGAALDFFGGWVAVSGDTAVAGASNDDGGRGSAYVFVRSGTTWSEQAKLIASDPGSQDLFGFRVALSEGEVVVGALNHDSSTGAAYVYDFAGPLTSNVMADPNPASVAQAIILSAELDDTDPGGSTVVSAEYKIRDADDLPVADGTGDNTDCPSPDYLCPVDDPFDDIMEDVEVTIPLGVVASLGPGVYEACVRGADANGNVGDFEQDGACTFLVIYDPSAGFVTGGGSIISPTGAYIDNPALTGKAQFGFVSKYKKGANVPTGNTHFQFKTAGLEFKSTEYEWLVIAGPLAQYKGSGTINDAGDFGFMLTAKDADISGGPPNDTFRIKIWDNGPGNGVVYDNGTNQEIDHGSIKIHN